MEQAQEIRDMADYQILFHKWLKAHGSEKERLGDELAKLEQKGKGGD